MADAIQFTVPDDDFIELTGAGVSGSVLHQGSNSGSASSIVIVDASVKPSLDAESSKRFQESPATIYLDSGEHKSYTTDGKLWAVSQSGEQLLSMTPAPSASGEPAPSGLYEGERAITVQTYTEANSKLGSQHEGSTLIEGVAGGASNNTIFLTGSLPVSLKGRIIGYTGEGVKAEIFESPTYTGGTSAPYQNASAINPIAGLSQIIVGATVSASGDLKFAPDYLIGNTSRQGKGTSGVVVGRERLLKPNTAYLLKITSLDSQAQDITSLLTWYEGELDLPVA